MTVNATALRDLPVVHVPENLRFAAPDGRKRPVRAVLVGGKAERPGVQRLPLRLWETYGILVEENWATDMDALRSKKNPDMVLILADLVGHTLAGIACKRGPNIRIYSQWSKAVEELTRRGWKPVNVPKIEEQPKPQAGEPTMPVNRPGPPVAATAPVSRPPTPVTRPPAPTPPAPWKPDVPAVLTIERWAPVILEVLKRAGKPIDVATIRNTIGVSSVAHKRVVNTSLTELQRTHQVKAHDHGGLRNSSRWRLTTAAEKAELTAKYGPRVHQLSTIGVARSGGRKMDPATKSFLMWFLDNKTHSAVEIGRLAGVGTPNASRIINHLRKSGRLHTVSGQGTPNALYSLRPGYDPAMDGLQLSSDKARERAAVGLGVEQPEVKVAAEGSVAKEATTRPAVAAESRAPVAAVKPRPPALPELRAGSIESELKAALGIVRDLCKAHGITASITCDEHGKTSVTYERRVVQTHTLTLDE